ncbi:hypothetical protein FACS18942_03900 [Planctomycetales bacterium]|nr:hypothetical protein FACS18942_03900 [Planctomycetales bacterium]
MPGSADRATDTGSNRARTFADQLRRSRTQQQEETDRNRRARGDAGLIASNLTGLETFGDALGAGLDGGSSIFLQETFTINSGAFSGSTITATGFTTHLSPMSGGFAVPITIPGNFYDNTYNNVSFSSLPAGLRDDIAAYIGSVAAGSGGSYPATISSGLVEYAKSNGIDPSQLTANLNESYVSFAVPAGNYPLTPDFLGGQIQYDYLAEYIVPLTPGGGGIFGLGRQKITENMTPLPTDRLIFDYSYFHNVPIVYRKMAVNRFTPGFEKTFFNKRFSVEMRLPLATTIDNTIYSDNNNSLNVMRIGDMTTTVKWLVFQRKKIAMTFGLSFSLPLAEDMNLVDTASGRNAVSWKNETVHLMPYVGILYMPKKRTFFQAYFQVDAAVHGDSTYVGDYVDTSSDKMIYAGKTFDRTYAYTSTALGYWLYQQNDSSGNLRNGMNVIGELHWTQSLDKAKGVTSTQGNYNFDIGRADGSYHVLDMTLGTRLVFNKKTNVGLGYSVPLSSSNSRQFDGEFRLTYNRYL